MDNFLKNKDVVRNEPSLILRNNVRYEHKPKYLTLYFGLNMNVFC